MKITVSIPAYNEEETIESVIREVKKVMDSGKYSYKIQLVDDGSEDKTAEKAKSLGAKVFVHPYNYGLAETFRTEIKKFIESDSDIFIHIDADGQYDCADIPKLLQPIIKKEADLVLGNRFLGGIEYMPFMKRIGNKAFSYIISKVIRHKIGDCQTGFRAFTKEVAEKIPIINTYSYTQEQIIRCVREKFRVKEVPVKFRVRRSGKSKLISNPFDYAIKAWINILRIYRDFEPLKFFGYIGFTLISIGLIIGAWLVSIFIKTGRVGHLPSTILSGVLILVGIQILLFGFFADMNRK